MLRRAAALACLAFVLASPVRQARAAAMEAVVIAGDLHDQGTAAQSACNSNMAKVAAKLRANGCRVWFFRPPTASWTAISAAAAGAEFLVYSGHGIYWSSSGSVGGMYIGQSGQHDGFVTPREVAGLTLAPGAVTILQGVCYSAGTSSSDAGSITQSIAFSRVAQYSHSFLDAGAGAYLADWYQDSATSFISAFFSGKTLGQVYTGFYDYSQATAMRYRHPFHTGLYLWLDRDTIAGKTQYDFALAGSPGKNLNMLFSRDVLKPSVVLSVPSAPSSPFKVTWAGRDTAPSSGIASYDVQYLRQGDAAWKNLRTTTRATSLSFSGTGGVAFSFRARARDKAGNVGQFCAAKKALVR